MGEPSDDDPARKDPKEPDVEPSAVAPPAAGSQAPAPPAATAATSPSAEIHEVLPREQVGAVTGERYDFQYHQAAADVLLVLDDTKVACVYCEWHDDYVIEAAGVVSYRFHQVKTRTKSQGPWTLNEFFGIKPRRGPKPKNEPTAPAGATADSIFGRLLDHVTRFGDRCEGFVFVTDAGITTDFQSLLGSVAAAPTVAALTEDPAKAMTALHASLVAVFPTLTLDAFFDFVKRFSVKDAIGSLQDSGSCRILIGGRILEMSEVDLRMSEAQKIGAELVAMVRDKSHRVLPTLPATMTELRSMKGLVLDDVLRILSLSAAGYRDLKSGGRASVVELSRLHRLCRRSGVAESLIPDLCRLKTTWEAWWIAQRHVVNSLDQVALKKECADALRVHIDGKLDFNGLRDQAKALAAKYAAVLTSTEPIGDEQVFGLMMALAVETQ